MRPILHAVIAIMVLFIGFAIVPSSAVYPMSFDQPYPQTVWTGKGVLYGTVAPTINATFGVRGCYVAIVNASNLSEGYYHTTTDAHGHYVINGINMTYNVNLGEGPDGTKSSWDYGNTMYMVYVNKSPYGEGYSGPFGIDYIPDSGTHVDISLSPLISPIPMFLWGDISHSKRLSRAHIIAFVYNASGYPVADGTVVDFAMGVFNESSPGGNMYGTYSQYDHVRTSGGRATINYTRFPPNLPPNACIGITATLNKTPNINYTTYIPVSDNDVYGNYHTLGSLMPSSMPVLSPTLLPSPSPGPGQTSDAAPSPTSTPLSPLVTLLSLAIGAAIVLAVRRK